jgi:hypothetical protein
MDSTSVASHGGCEHHPPAPAPAVPEPRTALNLDRPTPQLPNTSARQPAALTPATRINTGAGQKARDEPGNHTADRHQPRRARKALAAGGRAARGR